MSETSTTVYFRPRLDLAFANLTLRLWVALRLVMAGVDKFRSGDGAAAVFSMENYEKKSGLIATLMTKNSFLPSIMSPEMINTYAHSIGYALIGVGAWVLIGLLSEFALVAAGLTFISLGFGLAALPDDMELTANIGTGIVITALALMTNRHGFLSVDGLFRRGRKTVVTSVEE
jgi:uncharacterized membrane protein YphA (DoxX/SURF4 family)